MSETLKRELIHRIRDAKFIDTKIYDLTEDKYSDAEFFVVEATLYTYVFVKLLGYTYIFCMSPSVTVKTHIKMYKSYLRNKVSLYINEAVLLTKQRLRNMAVGHVLINEGVCNNALISVKGDDNQGAVIVKLVSGDETFPLLALYFNTEMLLERQALAAELYCKFHNLNIKYEPAKR